MQEYVVWGYPREHWKETIAQKLLIPPSGDYSAIKIVQKKYLINRHRALHTHFSLSLPIFFMTAFHFLNPDIVFVHLSVLVKRTLIRINYSI